MMHLGKHKREYIYSLRQDPAGQLANIYDCRGRVHILIGKYDKAMTDFASMRAMSGINGSQALQARSYINIGNVYHNRGDFKAAEGHYLIALALCREKGIASCEAECNMQMGKIKQYLEKYEEACAYYHKAREIFKELGDDVKAIEVNNYHADALLQTGDNDHAIDLLSYVINNESDKKASPAYSRGCQILGKALAAKNDFENGLKYLARAYSISSSISDQIGIAYITCDMGVAEFERGEYQKAIGHLEECLRYCEKLNNLYLKSIALINLGDCYHKSGDMEKAREYLTRTLKMEVNIKGVRNEAQRILEQVEANSKREVK